MALSANVFAPTSSLIERIVWTWRYLTWYQVVIADRDNGYAMTWWARNEADALEWARVCKPKYSVAYGKRGVLLGGRRGVI